MGTMKSKTTERREYSPPKLSQWGSVADITQTGQTVSGGDILPDNAQGKDGGSIMDTGVPSNPGR